jgi:hypothetical protein
MCILLTTTNVILENIFTTLGVNLALNNVKKVQNSTTSCPNIEVFYNFAHHNFN